MSEWGGVVLRIFFAAGLLLVLCGCPGSSPPTASLAPPPAPTPVACSTSGMTASSAPDPRWPTVAGGTVSGPSLTLNAGRAIRATSDLAIVTQSDLIIRGRIELPARASVGTNLVLVSLHGKVLIDSGAYIGGGGPVRGNGGAIILSGQTVEILGTVEGNAGGSGLAVNDDPSANGTNGFAGGDVHVCADDGILLGTLSGGTGPQALVRAGDGGRGGNGTATGSNDTTGTGGNGGKGGDVIFDVRPGAASPDVVVDVFADPRGGDGGPGGQAAADSRGAQNGGNAEATGGAGGPGGTVRFPSAVVRNVAPAIRGGDGGPGGSASAEGGDGANAWVDDGLPGGSARGTGGSGGPPGPGPAIPLADGDPQAGLPGSPGHGAGASALAGSGGSAGIRSHKGGSTGIGKATGGPSGNGATPPAVPPFGPVAATGPSGAGTANVTAPGMP